MEIHGTDGTKGVTFVPLFDQFVVVKHADKSPELVYSFEGKGVGPYVSSFCFPEKNPPSRLGRAFFVFVLTGLDGGKQYGFCLRDVARGSSPVLVCYSVISVRPWFRFFQLLLEITWKEDAAFVGGRTPAFERILKTLIIHPLPEPGRRYRITTSKTGLLDNQPLCRPKDDEMTLVIDDKAYMHILETLGPIRILLLFTAMLSERRIIFHGENISTLSACVHAALSLLYPLSWQHIFVPVLPPSLLEYCQAPMPFIVGVLSENMSTIRKMRLEEVVFVDLERGRVTTTVADAALLPQQKVHVLRSTMQNALAKKQEEGFRPSAIKHAFREFFLDMLGSYRRYLVGTYPDIKFNRRGFLRASSRANRKFLRVLANSQMFERWIAEREEWACGKVAAPQGLFEREVDLIDFQVPKSKRMRINPQWDRLTGVVSARRERRHHRQGSPKLVRTSSLEDIPKATQGVKAERRQAQSMRPIEDKHTPFIVVEASSSRTRPTTRHNKREKVVRRMVKRRVYKHPPFDMNVSFEEVHRAFAPHKSNNFRFPGGTGASLNASAPRQHSPGASALGSASEECPRSRSRSPRRRPVAAYLENPHSLSPRTNRRAKGESHLEKPARAKSVGTLGPLSSPDEFFGCPAPHHQLHAPLIPLQVSQAIPEQPVTFFEASSWLASPKRRQAPMSAPTLSNGHALKKTHLVQGLEPSAPNPLAKSGDVESLRHSVQIPNKDKQAPGPTEQPPPPKILGEATIDSDQAALLSGKPSQKNNVKSLAYDGVELFFSSSESNSSTHSQDSSEESSESSWYSETEEKDQPFLLV